MSSQAAIFFLGERRSEDQVEAHLDSDISKRTHGDTAFSDDVSAHIVIFQRQLVGTSSSDTENEGDLFGRC
jgi:hypothetical protein